MMGDDRPQYLDLRYNEDWSRLKESKAPPDYLDSIKYIPFEGDPPSRRVVLAWRRSFTRYEAIAALRNSIYACELPGVKRLS